MEAITTNNNSKRHRRPPPKNRRPYYYRRRIRSRDRYDIERQILNYLLHVRPTHITKLIHVIEINHSQAKRALYHLMKLGFIEQVPATQVQQQQQQQEAANIYSSYVKKLLIITKTGTAYLEKVNDLQLMQQQQQQQQERREKNA